MVARLCSIQSPLVGSLQGPRSHPVAAANLVSGGSMPVWLAGRGATSQGGPLHTEQALVVQSVMVPDVNPPFSTIFEAVADVANSTIGIPKSKIVRTMFPPIVLRV